MSEDFEQSVGSGSVSQCQCFVATRQQERTFLNPALWMVNGGKWAIFTCTEYTAVLINMGEMDLKTV